jgi:hypothetical protein
MLDPILQAALVGILVVVLKAVFTALGIEVDEVFLNTLATAIVLWLLAKFGLAAARAAARKAMGAKAFKDSALWANEE